MGISLARPRVAIMFDSLGPYHVARLNSAARHVDVIAVESSGASSDYAWHAVNGRHLFSRVTLFPQETIRKKAPEEVLSRVHEELTKAAPDCVALPGWSEPASLAALLWAKESGKPAVLMTESSAHDEPRRWWKELVKSRIVSQFSAALAGGSPHVSYLNQLGMDSGRVFTGYDVIDNDYFESRVAEVRRDSDNWRARFNLPRNYFLASARFIEKKNLPRLLDAFSIFRGRFTPASPSDQPWHLVLLGDGPSAGDLRDFAAKLSLGSSLILPGFLQYKDLPVFYALASAFVHASTTEQWGLVVNEAMSAGLPVIVSEPCGCAPDLVHSGVNGFTFDPFSPSQLADFMVRIASEDDMRKSMGEASLRIINEWGPQRFGSGLNQAANAARSQKPAPLAPWDRALLAALIRRAPRQET